MRHPARPAAMLAAVLIGACARDAPTISGPLERDPGPAPVPSAEIRDLSTTAIETVRVMLADVSERLLPALEEATAADLHAPIEELSATLRGGNQRASRLALSRAQATLTGFQARPELLEYSGPDLDAIQLILADVETLLLGERL